LGTGNYNDQTATFYTDWGMFTARESFGVDATAFFNHLTGYSHRPSYHQIVTAPDDLKDSLLNLIHQEIQAHTPQTPGRIVAKMNSLTEKSIIQALYQASCAGVQIDLIIRGICCLRPQIPGVSENIRVRSIVGRYLEHSRIYYFKSNGQDKVYLASSDWMTRNLDYRVEVAFPVLDQAAKTRVLYNLKLCLQDNVKARHLGADGLYKKNSLSPAETLLDSQLQAHLEPTLGEDSLLESLEDGL
jgi:polyphosphate kinase